jgi:hypothetical protein
MAEAHAEPCAEVSIAKPMMCIKASPNSHGFVNPRDIEQLWRDQVDCAHREFDFAVFPLTIRDGRLGARLHPRLSHRARFHDHRRRVRTAL